MPGDDRLAGKSAKSATTEKCCAFLRWRIQDYERGVLHYAPEVARVDANGDGVVSAAEGDVDSYAFDRRVTLRLELPGSGQVARSD